MGSLSPRSAASGVFSQPYPSLWAASRGSSHQGELRFMLLRVLNVHMRLQSRGN